MIKPNQLKVGLLVWWEAGRYMSNWNCPGVITKVDTDNNHYRVKTFDTMKETNDLLIIRDPRGDKSSLEEMRISSSEEVMFYLQKHEGQMKKAIQESKHELGQLKGLADQYFKKINILREELSAKPVESILPKV